MLLCLRYRKTAIFKKTRMKINYFFRYSTPFFHSIEEQFYTMQKKLPDNIKYENKYSKYSGTSIWKLFYNIIEAMFRQSEINHITGDIHYVALFLKNKKTILTIHDLGSLLKGNSFKQFILKVFWVSIPVRRVKYVTVISEFTKKQLIDNVKIKANKIFVIPDCVSPELRYSPKKFNQIKPIILQIGTKTNKNLINLFKSIKNINCKLLIVGKLPEKYKTLLSEFNTDYENYINIPYSEIVTLYERADIVSFISTYEGFGVPIIEANTVGRPVVTSNISPMKEVAQNAAVLVNPYDTDDIKNAFLKIIQNKEYRNSLITNGLENAKQYNAEKIALKYAELYKKTVNN